MSLFTFRKNMKYITSGIRRMWRQNKDVLNYEKVTYYPR